jgi:outer membrane protein
MNRIATFVLGAVGALLLAAGVVGEGREATASGTTVKVAVVDLERTLYETPAGKRADENFEKTRKKKQAELDKKQKELQKYAAELEKQATVLKEEVLKEKRAELEKKLVELQQLYVKLERSLAEERTKLIQDLLKQAAPHIEKLAGDEGIDIVVDASAVVWSSKAVDLTDKLNKKMK